MRWWRVSIEAALTDTQGLELVLGVGDRCTVTSAIQRPGSGHPRGSDGGHTSIVVLKGRQRAQLSPARWCPLVVVFFLLPPSFSLSGRRLLDYSPAASSVRAVCACATSLSLSSPINRVCAGRKQSRHEQGQANNQPAHLVINYSKRRVNIDLHRQAKCMQQLHSEYSCLKGVI